MTSHISSVFALRDNSIIASHCPVFADQPTVHLSLTTSLTESLLTATLSCLVDSSPPASIVWAKDGEELSRVEPTSRSVMEQFLISPVMAGSFGNYSCTATIFTTNNETASDSVEFSGEWPGWLDTRAPLSAG